VLKLSTPPFQRGVLNFGTGRYGTAIDSSSIYKDKKGLYVMAARPVKKIPIQVSKIV
jgi:hypothetical protein